VKTTPIDFFAPLVPDTLFGGSYAKHDSAPSAYFPKSIKTAESQIDRADRFTYIIMGLALLIAIVVPLLNLS
jgi:hypothetical protein